MIIRMTSRNQISGEGAAAGDGAARENEFKAREPVMYTMQDRRRFLATLSLAGAAGLVGTPTSFAQEAPPETTTIRLARNRSVCIAPQYVVGACCRQKALPTSAM
jgi:hypothetical protein